MSLHPQVLWSIGTGLCPQPGTSARPTSTTAGSLIARRPPLLTSGRSPPSPSQVRSQCSCRAGTPAALLLLLLAGERLCPAQHQHFKFLPNPPSPRQGVLSCPDHSRSVLVFVPPGLPESVSFRFTGTSATFFFSGHSSFHPSFALPIACVPLAFVLLQAHLWALSRNFWKCTCLGNINLSGSQQCFTEAELQLARDIFFQWLPRISPKSLIYPHCPPSVNKESYALIFFNTTWRHFCNCHR